MKTFRQLIEQIVNSAGPVASSDASGLAGVGDPPLVTKRRARKPDDKFAGAPVFDVEPKVVGKFTGGARAPYERWGKRMDMGHQSHAGLRAFAHRNPGKPIIVRNNGTKEMFYLRK